MRLRLFVLPILLGLSLLALPSFSVAQVGVSLSVAIAPPPIPVYAQPPIPDDGYLWVPGYWAYGQQGFYWVPGTWVMPPEPGLLWTPGYWEFAGGAYVWHPGYWGPQVGYYGGINYGFGYFGVGYVGGFWDQGVFRYNAAINNFGSRHIANVYRQTPANVGAPRASFAGGRGGTSARPSAEEQRAVGQPHREPTATQAQHEQAASTIRTQNATVNHARPPVAATRQPSQFRGPGVTAARAPAPQRQAPAAAGHPAPPKGGRPPQGQRDERRPGG